METEQEAGPRSDGERSAGEAPRHVPVLLTEVLAVLTPPVSPSGAAEQDGSTTLDGDITDARRARQASPLRFGQCAQRQ
jgi:hypothetical protein